jgi:hypothetical protein
MSDPTFTTRAELEAWVKSEALKCGTDKRKQLAALPTIRRVTLAHVHLNEETKL